MRSLAAWPSFWRMFIDVDLLYFETANYCHLFPSLPNLISHPQQPQQVPSPIDSDILQVSRAPQRIDLRSIRASASWTSWEAWKAWATSNCSRSMSSPRALKRRKPSRCNLPQQGWKVDGNCKQTGKYHNCDSRLLLGACSGSPESAI